MFLPAQLAQVSFYKDDNIAKTLADTVIVVKWFWNYKLRIYIKKYR